MNFLKAMVGQKSNPETEIPSTFFAVFYISNDIFINVTNRAQESENIFFLKKVKKCKDLNCILISNLK